MMIRHPDLCLTSCIGIINIDLRKAWSLIVGDRKKGPDPVDEFTVNAKRIYTGGTIYRMIDVGTERRESECIVIISNVGSETFGD